MNEELLRLQIDVGKETLARYRDYSESVSGAVKCKLCEIGIGASCGTLIVAALAAFPEDTPIIEAIAEICDLAPEVIEKIIQECLKEGLGPAIKMICQELGTCD